METEPKTDRFKGLNMTDGVRDKSRQTRKKEMEIDRKGNVKETN